VSEKDVQDKQKVGEGNSGVILHKGTWISVPYIKVTGPGRGKGDRGGKPFGGFVGEAGIEGSPRGNAWRVPGLREKGGKRTWKIGLQKRRESGARGW